MQLTKRLLPSLSICLPLLFASGASHATLIGQWTFEGSNVKADSTGNFGDLVLSGNASIANGKLTVDGTGTSALGWAGTSSYNGGVISSKTLVVWGKLTGLANQASAGSMMTLDSVSGDNFDGIIFSEANTNKWQNGSNNGLRNQPFNEVALESVADDLVQLAISYELLTATNQLKISGYRNGVSMGTYYSNSPSTWAAGNAEILFGVRHTVGETRGGLDAVISEARIYNTALTQQEIQALSIAVPEPASLAMFGLGLALLAVSRKRRA